MLLVISSGLRVHSRRGASLRVGHAPDGGLVPPPDELHATGADLVGDYHDLLDRLCQDGVRQFNGIARIGLVLTETTNYE